jgi:hypothetical protein
MAKKAIAAACKELDMADITRRAGLGIGAALAGAAVASGAEASGQSPPFATKINFKDPAWNRDTFARMDMDINPNKEKVGYLKGTVYGVRENEAVRPLFINEGFSVVRSKRLPDGSWRRLLREIVFYRDIKTGQIMKTWHNPYTNEEVKVVPIANDPFNYTVSEFYPEPPSYGGLNKDKPPKRPFLLDWTRGPNGTLVLQIDINLFYPAALQPSKWPRESAGPFNQVSELFIYNVKTSDVENPDITSLPVFGAWSRINPWLPWMLMGQAHGHVNYFNYFSTLAGLHELPADLVAAARELNPKFLSAPTKDYGPSLSSMENYALHEKPAPVPAGWSPPQTPAPPSFPMPPPAARHT